MILSLESQAQLFLLTIVLGGMLGVMYDCLRVLRRMISHKRLWVQIEDGIYWILAVFFAFGVMLYLNSGEIRFFALLGMLGGMGLYFLCLSPLVMGISDRIIYGVKWVIRLFFTILFTPFRLLWMLFSPPVYKISRICGGFWKRVLHSCKIYAKIKMKKIYRDCKSCARLWRQTGKKRRGFFHGRKEKQRNRKNKPN